MSKLTITEFVSLDGVMQSPGGEPGYAHAGWVAPYFSDELGAYKLQEQLAADILVLGRKTYDSFYGAWPNREGEMAEKINTMTKYVASTTLGSSDWHDTTVVADGFVDAIRELKDAGRGDLLVAGSRSVAHQLLDAGLADELHLQVFPVVLGSGARFYPERDQPIRLELVASEAKPNGVLTQTYAVA
jgi:dihydrofolate reductase